ncbi:MAG: methyl-accepting chemotaxis protein, partial [Helicobacter sp.]|nr:methyl-accepting chemotaxis protein [Helicobacter sp.]
MKIITKSLSSKIITCAIVVFLFIIVGANVVNYQKVSSNTIETFESMQKLALNASYNTINITMYIEAKQHLEMIAKSLEEIGEDDIVAQRKVLLDVAHLIQYPAVYVTYEDNGRTLTEYYDQDSSNTQVSNNWDDTPDLRGRNWYTAAKAAGDIIATPTYESQFGKYKGRMLSTVALPFTSKGQLKGVVAVDIFVDGFQNRFALFKRPEMPSMNVFITDSEGNVFTHESLKPGDPRFANGEAAVKAAMKQAPEGSIKYSFDTHKREGFYKVMPIGWVIVVTADESDYVKAVNESFLFSVIATVILMVIGSIVLFFVVKVFLKPLITIEHSLLSFFSFMNYETKTPPKAVAIKTDDELGIMSRAIVKNIELVKQGLEKDNVAITQAAETAKAIEHGNLTARITENPNNPQLIELKNVLNKMLDVLQRRVGSDMNEIRRVFDSY